MRIKTIKLKNFKGVSDGTFHFEKGLNVIKGRNGIGKSTMATAITWILTDKDYALRANPVVKPNGEDNVETTVEMTMTIGKADHVITKTQKTTTKVDASGVKKTSTANTYTVNMVPKAERDFRTWLIEQGIDTNIILPLMHPAFFTSQKSAEMRAFLFELVKDVATDADMCAKDPELKDIAKLLKDYSLGEVVAMKKADKKRYDTECKDIPAKIDALMESKSVYDLAELEKEKEIAEAEINELEAKRVESTEKTKLAEIELEIGKAEANAKEVANRANYEAQSHRLDLMNQRSNFEMRLADAESDISRYQKRKDELATEYTMLKRQQIKVDTKCKYCGQLLPAETIDKYGKKLEKEKKERLDEITSEGHSCKNKIAEAEKRRNEIQARLTQLSKGIAELTDSYTDYKDILAEDTAYHAALAKYENLKAKSDEEGIEEELLFANINTARNKVDEIIKKIAIAEHDREINKKINGYKKRKIECEQFKADAEKILYQADLLSRKKNEKLSDDINSHFRYVNFVLFEYLKNGNYSEVCIPTIDGKRFGESVNTGLETVAKIDICESFQKALNVELPILLDNAECLNDANIPNTDCQLIAFKVTEDEVMQFGS